MAQMQDRYGQDLEVGDRVVIATLSHGSAHLREGTIRRFKTSGKTISAGIRTEAGGNTTVGSASLVRLPDGIDTTS